MKKLILAAALATMGFAGLSTGASAMPATPGIGADSSLVETIAYGCGRGFVPNRWGRCVPNQRPAPAYRPGRFVPDTPAYRRGPVPANRSGYGRACPPGTRLGPRGGYCHPAY
ncbi:GCG_CRPN prefix-to-repeats domain-containing protein [Labrys neptuniae]